MKHLQASSKNSNVTNCTKDNWHRLILAVPLQGLRDFLPCQIQPAQCCKCKLVYMSLCSSEGRVCSYLSAGVLCKVCQLEDGKSGYTDGTDIEIR